MNRCQRMLWVIGVGAMASAIALPARGQTFSMDAQGPSEVAGVQSWPPFGPFFEGDILSAPIGGPPLGTPAPGSPPPGVVIPGGAGGLLLVPFAPQEVDALSYGTDSRVRAVPWLVNSFYFSVDEFATGIAGTLGTPSVLTEGAFGPNFEAAADVFTNLFTIPRDPPPAPAPASPPAGNVAVIDGDGLANAEGVAYPGVGLIEPDDPFVPGEFSLDPGDNLDGLDVDTTPANIGGAIFFSLDTAFADPLELPPPPNFGSAVANGFVGGDVLWMPFPGAPGFPAVYAAAGELGLDLVPPAAGGGPDSDDLDALILAQNGIPGFQASIMPYDWLTGASDMLLFSVRRGSAVVGMPDSRYGEPISPGDILTTPIPPGLGGLSVFPAIFVPAEYLGLATLRSGTAGAFDDDLDALDYIDRPDCNNNNVWDDTDVANGPSADCNGNRIPDECEADCNRNNVPDSCDVDPADPDGNGLVSADCDANEIPDECEADCNGNGVPDRCDVDPADPDGNGLVSGDCNGNRVPDECDVDPADPDGNGAVSFDCGRNGMPDECETDCNHNGIVDSCDIAPADPDGNGQVSSDCNRNSVPDECDLASGPIGFGPAAGYTSPSSVESVVAADLNGDRNPDLVWPDYATDRIWIRLNNGNGTYATATQVNVGDGPVSVAAADMNGDTDVDIVVVNYIARTIQILQNNGLGTSWSAATLTVGGSGPRNLVLGDFDRDGDPDIVVTNPGDNNIRKILVGAFATTVTSNTAYTVGNTPIGLAVGDLYAHGHLGLVVANYGSGTVTVLHNDPDGTFHEVGTYAAGASPYAVALADLDWANDQNSPNDADLIVSHAPPGSTSADTVSVLINRGVQADPQTGELTLFMAPIDYPVGVSPVALAAVDLDGDGDPEIVAGCRGSAGGVGGGVYVLPNLSNVYGTSFGAAQRMDTTAAQALTTGRLNSDGFIDVVADGAGTARVLLNRFGPASPDLNANTVPDECENADCNSNGILDAFDIRPRVAFADAEKTPTNLGGDRMWIADLDGDGDLDVVTTSSLLENPLFVLRNDGTGRFPTSLAPAGIPPQGVSGVAIGDVDRDGLPDLALADGWNGRVLIARNTGSGGPSSFGSPVVVASGVFPGYIVGGDLDGDGDFDLVFADYGNDRISVMRNTSTGGTPSFGAPVNFAAGDGPTFLSIADVDNDSDLDVLVMTFGSGDVRVLYNDGSGSFPTAGIYTFSSSPIGFVTGDVDADGYVDLVVTNGDNVVRVRRNNRDGTFAAPAFYAVDALGGYPPALGDLDGDGDLDIAVVNYVSTLQEYISMLPNNGNGTFGAAVMVFDTRRYGGFISAVDLDRDGLTDLAVRARASFYGLLNRTMRTGNLARVFSASPNTAIPSGPGTVTTAPLSVTSFGRIEGIDVTVDITHPYPGGLTLRLNHPDGTGVILASNRSGFGSGFTNTVFDDDAGYSFWAAQAPLTGRFQPTPGTLGALTGKPAAGNWTLSVIDSLPGDTGTIVSWSLTLRTAITDDNGNGVPDSCDCADRDGDGYPGPLCPQPGAVDCDDTNPSRYPGSSEVCNGLDDDCDGSLPANEMDGDGDGHTSCQDCDDANIGVWRAPGEATGLTLAADRTTLTWSAPSDLGGISVLYDTLRSADAGDFGAGATCVESDGADTTSTDAVPPAVGEVIFYLVVVENACPARNAGMDSSGSPRVTRACP